MTRIRLAAFAALFSFFSVANAGLFGGSQKDLYIVQLNEGLTPITQAAAGALSAVGADPAIFEYDSVLFGFAAALTPRQVRLLKRLPVVSSIEKDVLVQVDTVWGVDRSDQRNLPLDGAFNSVYDGAGAHVYVIDTGINPNHADLAGRVGAGQNFVTSGAGGLLPVDLLGLLFGTGQADPDDWGDCNGHGTHVAGSAGGSQYGLAKESTLHAVRVLNCQGSGSGSAIIAGMEWVVENAERPAVVNMSLGTVGGRSQAQEDAAAAMFRAGILPVVAAGNDSTDACSTSPSAEPLALTIGASDRNDAEASFSNYGTCVDMYAPGVNIVSASHSNDNGSATMSGTSMAAPHVAGAAALLLGANPNMSPADLTAALVGNASVNKLSGLGAGSPNLLLYTD